MSENKITEEQLKNLQDLVAKINNAAAQLGNIEMQKHQLLHASNAFQSDLNNLQKSLEEEYGKVSVNIQDGTFAPIPEETPIETAE
jgi:predicted transcriptional regulator